MSQDIQEKKAMVSKKKQGEMEILRGELKQWKQHAKNKEAKCKK